MTTAIRIENLWKEYRLGVIGHGTLSHDLQSWWARIRGHEDPNAKLETAVLTGQEKQIDGDRFWALSDINLDIKQGEVLGIIGRNGAGKSTLLKVLSRVTGPSRGSLKVKGRIASLLEVGTGFHPELTGRENIFLNGAILGMSKVEIRKKLEEIIDFSGVEDFVDTPVKRYSSGMYVRLAFAVAAHLEPEILVVDEVLAVGDAAFQKKCLGKMGEVSKEGRTILFVSHNMGAVQELCTRAILLSGGRKQLDGTVGSIIDSYLASDTTQSSSLDLSSVKRKTPQKFARLRRFAMMNGEHSLTTHFKMGQPLCVQVELEIQQRMENAEIGVKISSRQGTALHYLTSTWEGMQQDLEPGLHMFEVCMSNVLLFPGKYQIGLWVLRQGEPADDTVQGITFFDVIKGDVNGRNAPVDKYAFSGCEVYAPCQWKVITQWRNK